MQEKKKINKESSSILTSRAWIEVNLANLEHNVNEIKKVINPETKIMAIVKANAYGCGLVTIAKKLNEIGVTDLAVASLEEGITLRQNGIQSNILILGYTDINNINLVEEYNLIQTLVDIEYVEKISKISSINKLKAYIKINTGMNRIGIKSDDIEFIKSIYDIKNMKVEGLFTHFCVADSLKKEDIAFSEYQINEFNKVVNALREANINFGKIHMQNSYGILNYNYLNCDYVRPGIIMYGALVEKDNYPKVNLNLKPVLSLKARVGSVKTINKEESVSYGRTFIADKPTKIATLCIGYGDGYPRSISNSGAHVLINGHLAPIVGRICMDQLMIDVTDIPDVKQGDIATLIGNQEEISIEQVSLYANTITNDLLCRLGQRLDYIYIDE